MLETQIGNLQDYPITCIHCKEPLGYIYPYHKNGVIKILTNLKIKPKLFNETENEFICNCPKCSRFFSYRIQEGL